MDLDDLLAQVKDRESFLLFVKALIRDRQDEVKKEKETPISPYGPGENGWENGTIENYLDAAAAWMEAWIGKEHELPEEPSWQSFARFLYAGKYYE
jgi:hypothetical protein